MTFNMPITIHGDVSMDSITRPGGYESLKIESVLSPEQIEIELNQDGDMSEIQCRHCGQELSEDDPTVARADGDTECPANDDGPHEKTWAPFTWAKNIAISFDEDNDTIDLTIATGEPRGGWQFRLRRTPNGVVLMHLPHEDMSEPHEPLKEIHPGTFAIG